VKIADKLGNRLANAFILLCASVFFGVIFAMAVPAGSLVGMQVPFIILSGLCAFTSALALIAIFAIMIQGNKFDKGIDKASIKTGLSTQFVTIVSKYAYDENQIMHFPSEPGIVESGQFYIQVMFESGEKDEVQVSESLYFSVGEMMKGNATIYRRKMSSFTPIIDQQSHKINESEWTQK